MPLNATDDAFIITGKVGSFNGTNLNAIIEPLGMGLIKSGNINSFSFNLKGNDVKGEGDAVLLYYNFQIKRLKK